jgi:phage tail-like protein
MADVDYPTDGFFYSVSLNGTGPDNDSCFEEVSGLAVEMGAEEVSVGGENRFKHGLPTGARNRKLTLKRGLVLAEQPFYQWCAATFHGDHSTPIAPKSVSIVLKDSAGGALKKWTLVNALPVNCSLSDFSAMEGQVAIETIELSF